VKSLKRRQVEFAAAWLGGLSAMVFLCGWSPLNDLIYHPSADIYNTPEAFNIKYERLTLNSASGLRLNAWRVPGKSEITFLVFSGNAGNISVINDRLVSIYQMGYSAFAVDYPGFGSSEGEPGESGTYEAAEAAWIYLTQTLHLSPDQIVIYGFSLGGGVASWLAARHSPGALILDSTFTRLSDAALKHLPGKEEQLDVILGDAYDTASRLAEIYCPLLILHNKDDRVVPHDLGLKLYETYQNGSKQMVSGEGGHMDFMLNHSLYLPDIKAMADSLEKSSK